MEEYKFILKKYFGFDKFRNNQLDIINAIIKDKKDVCAIMYTGSGKSLCYQFPSVYLNKTSLIISPLISLMEDQLMKMNECNIPTVCLNSTTKNKNDLKKDILNGKYRLVYITPEYLEFQKEFIEELNKRKLLISVIIDEAHVISSWACDFRVSYMKLNCLKKLLPNIPIGAFTATATLKVQEDIIKTLKLEKPFIIRTTFDRPNLVIKVKQKSKSIIDDILPLINNKESTIIYCQTRKITDKITDLLQKAKIKCKGYHAGMDSHDRDEIHKEFITNKIICIVATVAFGMGIDAVIRKVIHYGIPRDMESYYQEIGRAGRDGIKSECYILYSSSDNNQNDYFINQITNQSFRDYKLEISLFMKKYIFSTDCRRKLILNYFGEEYKRDNCGNCDNCLNGKKVIKDDFTIDADLLLQTVNETGNIYGGAMLINVLRGSNNKKVPNKFRNLNVFDQGNHHSEQWWKIFIRMMINNGYIKEKAISRGHGLSLCLSEQGNKLLSNNKDYEEKILLLQVPEEMQKITGSKYKNSCLKLSLTDDHQIESNIDDDLQMFEDNDDQIESNIDDDLQMFEDNDDQIIVVKGKKIKNTKEKKNIDELIKKILETSYNPDLQIYKEYVELLCSIQKKY